MPPKTATKKVDFIGNELPNGVSVNPQMPLVGLTRKNRRWLYEMPIDADVPNEVPLSIVCNGKRILAMGVLQLIEYKGTRKTFVNQPTADLLGLERGDKIVMHPVTEIEARQIQEAAAQGGSWPDAEVLN